MTDRAINYGEALYELAAEEHLSEQILTELDTVCDIFKKNPDYVRLLSEPSVPKKERCAVLHEAFDGKLQPYLLNFLKLLCEHGRIRQLPDCLCAYRTRFNADNGILEATAITAAPLQEAQKRRLTDKLQSITGKRVDLQVRLDPSLLGGIRLQMDGKELDGTVRGRLDSLRRSLSDTVL